MKRLISFFAILTITCLSLAACGNNASGLPIGETNEGASTVSPEPSEPAKIPEPSKAPEGESGTAMPSETYAAETASSPETETASEDVADTDTSPFLLWEYEGYVDECKGYTWQKEFKNCDYDGDGKTDRLSRSWNGEEQTAIYTIEFGNGDRLVSPEGWETGFPHVQSGDLDSDGTKEILLTLSYDTGTDPYSYGEMWLFDKDEASGEYKETDLPLTKGEKGAKGFDIDYEKPENGKVRFTIREAGLSKEEDLGDEYISYWWTDEATSEMRSIYWADIKGGDNPVIRCYFQPFPRGPLNLGFDLIYNNGKYEPGYIEIDDPHEF